MSARYQARFKHIFSEALDLLIKYVSLHIDKKIGAIEAS